MKKRILSIVLAILLCLNLIPFNVVAAEEKAPASQREAVSAEEDPTEKGRAPASPSEAVPEGKEEKNPPEAEKAPADRSKDDSTKEEDLPAREKVSASPSDAVPGEEEPYYLFLVHFLDIDGGQYASSELVELEPDDLLDSAYDLRQNILEKEGMKAVAASLSASFRSRKPWRTTLFPST